MDKVTDLNKYLESTLLKPEATSEQIEELCREAVRCGFRSVCVNPCYVGLAKKTIADEEGDVAPEDHVKTVTVIGFPLGASATQVKSFEAAYACMEGADEVDMVMNIGAFKSGDYKYVSDDINSVVYAAGEYEAKVKVIIETCLLSKEEIMKACEIVGNAGAAFVKSSTGFNTEGATVRNIFLMRGSVSQKVGIKAAGGIRDLETALDMIEAGADVIGSSSCAKIMDEYLAAEAES
ncbi:MAG: deoxyribose-phosphate aldolase [Eubacteriales bacterium]|nr:deoxyribose-phosphate aldolase [Eubacteriales bacterium]